MNYFQAYLPSLDEAIVAAWDSQVAGAAETPWLAQALATKSADLFPRFASCYAQLRALPRGARRALQRRLARSCELAIPFEWQRKLAGSLAGAALLLALGQGTAQAVDITVNTNNPAINGADNKCSLIEAIINANDDAVTHPNCVVAGSGADKIILQPNKTITLTTPFVPNYSGPTGLPVITTPITIEGAGGSKIVRKSTGPQFRLLAVSNTGDLTLKNVNLSRGRTAGNGGGVFNNGTLTITNSTLSGNSAAGAGGGIFSDDNATVTITNSTLSGNTAYDGGGIFSDYFSVLTIDSSKLLKNRAALGGGVFGHDNGSVDITNTTISGNSADYGGGTYNASNGTMTIQNSTVMSNRAVYIGGGVYNLANGTVTISNSTISGNKAGDRGGGVSNDAAGTMTIDNSTKCFYG